MAKLWRFDEANDVWIKVSEDEPLPVTLSEEDIVIKTGDVELGAVELKDATTETRAVIGADGLVVTLGTALDSDTDSITTVPQPAASLGHGIKNVTTAGTDVALAASTTCKYVTVQARYENTSVIAVGGSGVDATATTGTGVILESGDSITLDVDNLADVYIDSRVNGEGVRYTYGVA